MPALKTPIMKSYVVFPTYPMGYSIRVPGQDLEHAYQLFVTTFNLDIGKHEVVNNLGQPMIEFHIKGISQTFTIYEE